MNETDEMFEEVQNVGMADVGTAVEFDIDGESYSGVISNPDTQTQMLTGGYQGRSMMVIVATREQFASQPAQKGVLVITQPAGFAQSQWNRMQVEPYGANHYSLTIMKQLTTA